jgi:hypothetical protein
MLCVAIATSYPRDVLADTAPPPHFVVADYDEFLDGPGAALTIVDPALANADTDR